MIIFANVFSWFFLIRPNRIFDAQKQKSHAIIELSSYEIVYSCYLVICLISQLIKSLTSIRAMCTVSGRTCTFNYGAVSHWFRSNRHSANLLLSHRTMSSVVYPVIVLKCFGNRIQNSKFSKKGKTGLLAYRKHGLAFDT